ncbi:MAG: DUF1501 domain-containing protein [Acidobacteria bacterium]|nr:DUF1501 domain-containing protein [Acidobacteriota bacterium]
MPDLTLAKSRSPDSFKDRQAFLSVVDRIYRSRTQSVEHSDMDGLIQQAWNLILTPAVRAAFDLAEEPEKVRDACGRDSVGQSLLPARRLVEACRRSRQAGPSACRSSWSEGCSRITAAAKSCFTSRRRPRESPAARYSRSAR